jgi:hypothetical protein
LTTAIELFLKDSIGTLSWQILERGLFFKAALAVMSNNAPRTDIHISIYQPRQVTVWRSIQYMTDSVIATVSFNSWSVNFE